MPHAWSRCDADAATCTSRQPGGITSASIRRRWRGSVTRRSRSSTYTNPVRRDPRRRIHRGVMRVTGAGRAFVAGADIAELDAVGAVSAKALARRGQLVFNRIESSPKPIVAAVNGFALGGGCELAMACHLRIASESAKFGQPEVKLGTIPGYGGTQRLPRLVGRGRALQLLLTGEMIDAADAYRIGLANRIVPTDQ